MKAATLLVLLVPSLALAAPSLSIDMNGEYRCGNGKTFTVSVLNAAVVDGRLHFSEGAATRNGPGGSGHTRMQHDITGFDLYGAGVTLDGTQYRLLQLEGATLALRDADGRMQWDIDAAAAPYAGRLRLGPQLLGENCIKTAALAAPKD